MSDSGIRAWLNIRPGEERSTTLMLLHSFFMGTSTVFFETAASALFLSQFEAGTLPYVYLAAAAVSIFTGLLYTRLKDRVQFTPLMFGTLVALFALVCLMRLGLGAFEAAGLIFAMMIAYRLVSMLTDLEYWALAARLYDVQQSKRLYSLIGSGEVTARILGAFSVPVLVTVIGVANLLWLSAAGLLLCVTFFAVVVRSFPEVSKRESTDTGKSPTRRNSPLRALIGHRYLQLIFLLAFFAVLGKYFVDFAFLTEMQTRWQAVENLAAFFGVFSGITQVLNLVIRVFVSGRVLNRFGVGVGMLVLPIVHILCTLVIALMSSAPAAVFWLVIVNQGLYKTLKHPIDNPSFKILYQPLPRRERLAAQIAVEVIVTPVAIAVAATMMIVFTTVITSVTAFAYLMLANFVAWGLAATFAFRQYGKALLRALERRSLDRASFSIEDEKSVALIRSKLSSEYAEDVIFALDLLQRVDAASLPTHWAELLSHPSPEVRRYALLQIESERPDSLAAAVGRLVDEESEPRVKAAALRALGALGDPNGLVAAHLHDTDRVIERGALIGLMQRPGGHAAAVAQRRLEEIAVSANAADRVLACKVLAETVWHESSSMIQSLLADNDVAVRREAIRAAGKRRDAGVIPRVIEQLQEPRYRSHATRALLEFGDVATPYLADAIVQPTLSGQARAKVVRIAGRMRTFDRTSSLWRAYEEADEYVRQEALRALSACGYVQPKRELDAIVARVKSEVEETAWELNVLRDLGDDEDFEALAKSLHEEVEQNRERILLLLSFLYDSRTMLSVRDHLDSSSKEKRAYAAEILEVTLSQELKELTLPILENLTPAQRIERLAHHFPPGPRDRVALLRALLSRNDSQLRNWTKACAIYGAARSSTDDLRSELSSLANGASPLIAETSRWAIESNGSRHGSHGMLTIEKVILLKGVGMFAATSEDILADVATILEDVELSSGETVFSKGEQGDSMYIIVNGRVRVFDGDKTINFLDERDIFGELALLDPEPRSASVEAVEQTRLFRLDRNTLFELMGDNIGVVSGIMQVLCRRLRRMTEIAMGEN